MFTGKSQNVVTFIFAGLSLPRRSSSEKVTRVKIASDTLMTLSGHFFAWGCLTSTKINTNPATLLKIQFSISRWQNINYAMPNADNDKIDLKGS